MNYYCMLAQASHALCDGCLVLNHQCYVCANYQAGLTRPAYPMPVKAIDVTWFHFHNDIALEQWTNIITYNRR